MTPGYALIGASGYGREILPLAVHTIQDEDEFRRLTNRRPLDPVPDVIWVERDPLLIGTTIDGCPVVDFATLLTPAHRHREVIVSIADPTSRARVVGECMAAGFLFGSVVSRQHVRGAAAQVGNGAVICPYTIITANAIIGQHFHMNMQGYISHDCVIGDFVTFSPAVCCNGAIHIGDYATIGTGAMLKQGTLDRPLVIGDRAIVGMGAVVTHDVEPGTTVVGNPARVLP